MQIKTTKDVQAFFNQLLVEGLNFHPDEDFTNYVNIDTSAPTYTLEEAAERNSLMEKCFDVCERENVDIYDIGLQFFF